MRRASALIVVTGSLAVLALASGASGARRATRAERRGMTASILPRRTPYSRGGRIAWAEVSTAGPYAVAWVVARPHVRTFQDALLLLKGRRRHWRAVSDIYHTDCPGVPRKVLVDLRRFFATKQPKFIAPGVSGYRSCAARIAYAK